MIYRLSYTTLDAYERGDFDTALASYLGKPNPYPTPAMELGKIKHKLWEKEILKTGRIPKELGGHALKTPDQPRVEHKHVRFIDIGDGNFIQLVGVIDCEDGNTLYDWKVSIRAVNSFVNSKQKWFYKLLIPEAERFEFRAYNPILDNYGVAIIYMDDIDIDLALNWVITLGTDFINLIKNIYGTADKTKLDKIYKPHEGALA